MFKIIYNQNLAFNLSHDKGSERINYFYVKNLHSIYVRFVNGVALPDRHFTRVLL